MDIKAQILPLNTQSQKKMIAKHLGKVFILSRFCRFQYIIIFMFTRVQTGLLQNWFWIVYSVRTTIGWCLVLKGKVKPFFFSNAYTNIEETISFTEVQKWPKKLFSASLHPNYSKPRPNCKFLKPISDSTQKILPESAIIFSVTKTLLSCVIRSRKLRFNISPSSKFVSTEI